MALILLVALFWQSAEDLYRRGLLLLKQNAVEQAAPVLEEAARQQPDWPFVWLAIAELRLRQNRLTEADEAGKKAAQLAPTDQAIAKARGMLHSRLAQATSEPASAVSHWKEAIRLDPQREGYRLALAQFLLEKRVEKAAEAELREAVAAFPKNAEFHRLLGLALYAQGRSEAAIDSFLKAIDLDPAQDTYYAGLETLLPEAGSRLPAIRERLLRFAAANPRKALAPYLLALTTPEESEALLRRAIALDEEFWPAYFELQKFTWERGDVAETIRLLAKVLELNPRYAPAHYKLGQAYGRVGNREAARKEFELHHKLTTAVEVQN